MSWIVRNGAAVLASFTVFGGKAERDQVDDTDIGDVGNYSVHVIGDEDVVVGRVPVMRMGRFFL